MPCYPIALAEWQCGEFIYALQLFFFKNSFIIYFCLLWVLVAACRLSVVAGTRGYSSLWDTGSGALWHVGYYQTRDRTCVLCISRGILIHCTTREILRVVLHQQFFICPLYGDKFFITNTASF